ncbi:MAG: hypothetical protein ACRDB1_18210, partial [Microcoleaceae cyanobacterium]
SSVNLTGENTTISVQTIDDSQYEYPASEGIGVKLYEGQPSYIVSNSSASQTINDNESAPKIWLESTVNVNNPNNPSSEATGKSLFKIKVDNANKIRKEGVYVNFNASFASWDDLSGGLSGTTIYPDISSQDYFISIPIKDDSIYESGENITVTLVDDPWWYDLASSSTSITQPIIDNDMKASLSPVTPGPKEGVDNTGNNPEKEVGYKVTFDYPVQEATDIYVSYNDAGDDLFSETTLAVQVPYNSKIADAYVTPTDGAADTAQEGIENVSVTIADSPNRQYQKGKSSSKDSSTNIAIRDNEPIITISETNNVMEGEKEGTFILDFDTPSPQAFNNFKFKLSGTAKHATLVAPLPDTDYKLYYEAFDTDNKSLATGSIEPRTDLTYKIDSVPASTKKLVLKVITINNEVWEKDETVGIELIKPTFDSTKNGYEFYRLGTKTSSTLTIEDDEP